MKSKTINKILTGKFLAWSRSITDEPTRKLVEQNSIITGGSIVSMLLNEEVNDFDVYFKNAETAFAVAQYYVAKLKENPPATFKGDATHTVDVKATLTAATENTPARVRIMVKSAGIASVTEQKNYQYFEGMQGNPDAQAAATENYVDSAMGNEPVEGEITDHTEPDTYENDVSQLDEEAASKLDSDKKADETKRGKYRVLFVTANAITLSDQMQLILRFQGDVEEIHSNYDYTHCTSSYTSWDRKLNLRPDALECILTKELRYQGSKYPIASLIRLRKFITRGWTINAGQFVKMAYQVSKLNLNDASVLEDQLVGVDSAYFSQVIHQLQTQPDPKQIDGTYLMTLIDKIF